MRRLALLAALALLAVPGSAAAAEDPFLVCVTEPCGPQYPSLPLDLVACVGLPCDLLNFLCRVVLRTHCVD